jgi:cysteine-rich repeat protein
MIGACDDEEPRPLGAACTADGQCAGGLVCGFGRCRETCDGVAGCGGLPCVPAEDAAFGVCLEADDFVAPCALGCRPPTICDEAADRCLAACDATFNPCARDETCSDDGLCRPRCGDGAVDAAAGESCDDGGDSATCDADCTPAACGDGYLNESAGEVCDDGDTNPGDGCSSTCTSDETCGNGIVDAVAGEVCDDGGESATCDGDCTRPACGDGVANATAGEECDDGDTRDDGDGGCSSRCLEVRCGNSRLDPGEMLDLGETDPEHCFRCPGGAGEPPDCGACVYFVDLESATNVPDGRTWGSAFHTLGEAVDAAAATRPAGVESCAVWVASGTYTGEVEDGHVVALRPRVEVLGGFARGALDARGRADPAATVLDGGGAVRHVVVLEADAGDGAEAVLDGLTLRGGLAPTGTSGGGAFVSGAAAALVVRRCRFEGNVAREAGGGLAVEAGATAWVESTVFLGNSAATAAGIAVGRDARVTIVNSTFAANVATSGPAAVALADATAAADVTNAVVADGGATRDAELSPAVAARSTLFGAGEAGDPADQNLVGDPLFVDAAAGDVALGAGSPAIDRADGCAAPATDLRGAERADDVTAADLGRGPPADLGALEADGGASVGPARYFDDCCAAPVEHGGRWIRLCDPGEAARLPWRRAREACESRGAGLASIADRDESAAATLALAAAPGTEAWGGGRQVPVGAGWSWQWSDGETWAFPDGDPVWGWGDACYPPADDGGLCLALGREPGRGCPADCAAALPFVCEEGGDL